MFGTNVLFIACCFLCFVFLFVFVGFCFVLVGFCLFIVLCFSLFLSAVELKRVIL